MSEEVPPSVRERATRAARQVVAGDVPLEDLEDILAPHGFVPRIREAADPPVLVCYPDGWRADGTVQVEAIESLDRAIELPLFPGDAEAWETVAQANERVVSRVAAEYSEAHAANVRAFAEFMNNHRARRIEHATDADLAEFLGEYYPRNVWPDAAAKERVEESVEIAREVAADL